MNEEVYSLPPGPKLNLGCGPVQPAGWVNIDGSNRAWLAGRLTPLDRLLVKFGVFSPTEFGPHVKVCNLLRGLPYADDSVSCVYAGELWEHFEPADAAGLTAECYRVLAPGGVLRVCVPDGVEFWRKYLELFDQVASQPKEQRSAEPLRAQVQMFFDDICTRKMWLGSMGHTHKWQYDEVQLVELFESRGFVEVHRARFHESRIPDISQVERSDFLIVEGIKPPAST